MSELRNDQKLTTADIANPQRGRDAGSAVIDARPVPSQSVTSPEDMDDSTVPSKGGTPVSRRDDMTDGPLFREDELQAFRSRWDQVQASFVDEPRQAVEQADGLVANMVKRLAEEFANARTKLENQWDTGSEVSTEELRQILRRYRSFFNRLLPI
jgi:hypothetical protein